MTNTIKNIDLRDLEFDPHNPRFSLIYNDKMQPLDEIMDRMVKKENIQELMGSISEQGYFQGEPLLVYEDIDNANKFFVIEGNRRLAALKILNGLLTPSSKLSSFKLIIEEAKHIPSIVPCIVFAERKEVLRYLAYRHITGPKKWDSLSKAIYIKQLRNEFFSELPLDEQLKSIAKEMGSRKDYVAKMLTTLSLLEYAEDKDFFGLQRLNREDIDFSVLTTALGYANITAFIGLQNGSVVDFEKLNDSSVKDLFSWMFVQNESGETPLGESRNLGKLATILTSTIATNKLKEERNLQAAYLYTAGPEKTLIQSINMALYHLKNAYEIIPSLDSMTDDLTTTLDKIDEMNDSLRLSIKRKVKRTLREQGE